MWLPHIFFLFDQLINTCAGIMVTHTVLLTGMKHGFCYLLTLGLGQGTDQFYASVS